MPLSGNVLFCYDNKLLTATLSSNQTVLVPLTNLTQEPLPSIRTRIQGVTNVQITADLGAVQNVQAGILFHHNLQSTGTVELRHSSDNFAANNVLDDTVTVGSTAYQRCLPSFLANPVSARYWRWVLNDAGNPAGFLEVGIGFLGPILEWPTNIAVDYAIEHVDLTSREVGPNGSPHRTKGAKLSRVTFRFPNQAESAAQKTVKSLLRDVGTYKDFFLAIEPTHTDADIKKDNTLYGSLTGSVSVQGQPARGIFESSGFVFEETPE